MLVAGKVHLAGFRAWLTSDRAPVVFCGYEPSGRLLTGANVSIDELLPTAGLFHR